MFVGATRNPRRSDRLPFVYETIRACAPRDVHSADIRFFVGRRFDGVLGLKAAEVMVGCGDTYRDLPYKTKAILIWGLAHHYDFIFLW